MKPIKALDADAHVEEWEGVFSDKYFGPPSNPLLAARRPKVVATEFGIHWLIDGKFVMPRFRNGELDQAAGTPQSINGKRVDILFKKLESLECLELRGPEARLALMDEEGIEMQVLYPTLFLAWPLTDDPVLGADLCRSYNNWIAEVCNQSGGRLKWVTTVDPNDPKAAAEEIARTKQMGAVAVVLPGMAGERCIADQHFEPIWEAAGQVDMPVAIHVAFCTSLGFLNFHHSLLMGFWGVMFSGILDRYSKLHVAFLEAGCSWVPYMMERIEELMNPQRTMSRTNLITQRESPPIPIPSFLNYKSKFSPTEHIKRGNVYFSFEVEEKLLPWCIEEYGSDCWLYASDTPHADRMAHSVKELQERQDLTKEVKKKLLVDNCARFYKLPVPL